MSGSNTALTTKNDHAAPEGLLRIIGSCHGACQFHVDDATDLGEARSIIAAHQQDGFHFNVYDDQGKIIPML